MKITIDEFCAQWKNGKSSFIDSNELNLSSSAPTKRT